MSQISIALDFRIGESTVNVIIPETCRAIWFVLKEKVMPAPDVEKFQEISHGFEERWNFPHVIGSIDGKHCNIQVKKNLLRHKYYSHRKGGETLKMCTNKNI